MMNLYDVAIALLLIVVAVLASLTYLACALSRFPNGARRPPAGRGRSKQLASELNDNPRDGRAFIKQYVWRGATVCGLLLLTNLLGLACIIAPFAGLFDLLFSGEDFYGRGRAAATFAMAIMAYAWVAYFGMAVTWVAGKRIGKIVPITGMIAGIFGLVLTAELILPLFVLLPHGSLAVVMVKFHVSGTTREPVN